MRKRFIRWSDGKSKEGDGGDSTAVQRSLPPEWERYFWLYCWLQTVCDSSGGTSPELVTACKPCFLGNCMGLENVFFFKSEWTFDGSLELDMHTASDTLQGTHLLGSPDCSFCYTWSEAGLGTCRESPHHWAAAWLECAQLPSLPIDFQWGLCKGSPYTSSVLKFFP